MHRYGQSRSLRPAISAVKMPPTIAMSELTARQPGNAVTDCAT
ncbi:hypothetical protein [Thalassospira alkalitolerans]